MQYARLSMDAIESAAQEASHFDTWQVRIDFTEMRMIGSRPRLAAKSFSDSKFLRAALDRIIGPVKFGGKFFPGMIGIEPT